MKIGAGQGPPKTSAKRIGLKSIFQTGKKAYLAGFGKNNKNVIQFQDKKSNFFLFLFFENSNRLEISSEKW